MGQRSQTRCKWGHPLDERNTTWCRRRDGSSFRQCRACHNESTATHDRHKRRSSKNRERDERRERQWTRERVALLRFTWPDLLYTCGEIAALIGASSAQAVVGKARRLGLPRRQYREPRNAGHDVEVRGRSPDTRLADGDSASG